MENLYQGYVECAVWSSIDDDGNPLDMVDAELSKDAIAIMQADCERFETENSDLLEQGAEYHSYAHMGHDFWLTRNGHGAGFWDGDYPKVLGDALTKASKEFSECNLYVGDDNEIHIA